MSLFEYFLNWGISFLTGLLAWIVFLLSISVKHEIGGNQKTKTEYAERFFVNAISCMAWPLIFFPNSIKSSDQIVYGILIFFFVILPAIGAIFYKVF